MHYLYLYDIFHSVICQIGIRYHSKIKGVNLLCAHGRAGQTQHLFFWRRISQSEIRNSAAAKARAGREFLSPPTPFLSRPARAVRSFAQNKSELFCKGSSKQEIAIFQPTKSTVLPVGLRLSARRYGSPFERSSRLCKNTTANFLLFANGETSKFPLRRRRSKKATIFLSRRGSCSKAMTINL